LLTVLLVAVIPAQEPTTVKVDVRLVNVVATVSDAAGKHVPNLTAEDFTVYEDGVPQKIAHFSQDHDVPVSVGILLDTSGSMVAKIQTASEAIDRFINNVHPEDDIFLMTFAGRVTLEQDFTSDRKRLSRALNSLRISGGTVLYEALEDGIDKVQRGRHDKRAVLVLSDGFDAGSRRTNLERVLSVIRQAEVLVYGLGTGPTTYADPNEHIPFTLPNAVSATRGPSQISNARGAQAPRGRGTQATMMNGVNMTVMKQFAESSGGQAFLLSETFVNSGRTEIDRVLTAIADELRGQYTLAYYPSAPDNGRFHSIRVTTREGHNVRTRNGYQGRR
jgi:VWFA-related protein